MKTKKGEPPEQSENRPQDNVSASSGHPHKGEISRLPAKSKDLAGRAMDDTFPTVGKLARHANLAEGPSGHGERALYFHGLTGALMRDAALYAYLCGKELLALKEALDHGQFIPACEKLGIAHRTVTNYMSVVETLEAEGKLATVTSNLNLLANGELVDEDRDSVLEVFHSAIDGRTISELARANGIIRQPKHQENHPRKPSTPEDIVASELATAKSFAKQVIHAIRALMQSEDILPKVPRSLREDVYAETVQLNEAIRLLGKKG